MNASKCTQAKWWWHTGSHCGGPRSRRRRRLPRSRRSHCHCLEAASPLMHAPAARSGCHTTHRHRVMGPWSLHRRAGGPGAVGGNLRQRRRHCGSDPPRASSRRLRPAAGVPLATQLLLLQQVQQQSQAPQQWMRQAVAAAAAGACSSGLWRRSGRARRTPPSPQSESAPASTALGCCGSFRGRQRGRPHVRQRGAARQPKRCAGAPPTWPPL
jgi:hypothetical protein